MKNYYHFEDEIDTNTVNELINTVCQRNIDTLYFSTNGGYTDSMEVLIDFLNSNIDNIKVVLTHRIMSCGVDLLTDYKGTLTFSPNLEYILFHLSDRQEYSLRKEFYSKKKRAQILKEDNDRACEKYLKLGLSQKEIGKIKKGKNVIYYRMDFDKLNLGK